MIFEIIRHFILIQWIFDRLLPIISALIFIFVGAWIGYVSHIIQDRRRRKIKCYSKLKAFCYLIPRIVEENQKGRIFFLANKARWEYYMEQQFGKSGTYKQIYYEEIKRWRAYQEAKLTEYERTMKEFYEIIGDVELVLPVLSMQQNIDRVHRLINNFSPDELPAGNQLASIDSWESEQLSALRHWIDEQYRGPLYALLQDVLDSLGKKISINQEATKPKAVKMRVIALQKKLGVELFTDVIILQAALNKIYALWDLLHLTYTVTKQVDCARTERNRASSVVLAIGVLHELYNALCKLSGTVTKNGITHEKIIVMLSIYDKKRDMKDLMMHYRNDVSFHLHKYLIDVINKDLVTIAQPIDDFIRFDSTIKRDSYNYAAEEIINRAFFKKYSDNHSDILMQNSGEFEKYYKENLEEFLDYVWNIHQYVFNNADSLIKDIIDEYNLVDEELYLD